ncbi:uncharacterized protein LOC143296045 [Babylonia areolata]|uniref:uncharacterized protein LOC143296045 n=1 Tax=Babylonia areolata TaxID=304850 RepID=UPI003FCFE694
MYSVYLCAVVFVLAVGTVQGVVTRDCSSCGSDSTCQENTCKQKVGAACNISAPCVTNANCSTGICRCSDPFMALLSNKVCAKVANIRCQRDSECLPDAKCEDVVSNGVTTKRCKCKHGYTFDSSQKICSGGQGLVASLFLLATAIFVTSRPL